MRTMNKAEQKALKALWDRMVAGKAEMATPRKINGSIVQFGYSYPTYRKFRRTAEYSNLVGCWIVPWLGITVGIESNGYTHS